MLPFIEVPILGVILLVAAPALNILEGCAYPAWLGIRRLLKNNIEIRRREKPDLRNFKQKVDRSPTCPSGQFSISGDFLKIACLVLKLSLEFFIVIFLI
jgi:hypothetical protein